MSEWKQLTNIKGETIYVNLANILSLFRNDVSAKGTVISFVGSGDHLVVKEQPQDILSKAAL
jgi:hypothetical protein